MATTVSGHAATTFATAEGVAASPPVITSRNGAKHVGSCAVNKLNNAAVTNVDVTPYSRATRPKSSAEIRPAGATTTAPPRNNGVQIS
ncbi:hypothetical protein BQ8420_31320 [Nocardiopsis sp. JB363]|nr:hypothetical protein BQ8420_31320 [Nocardiopsis sp. JB363]